LPHNTFTLISKQQVYRAVQQTFDNFTKSLFVKHYFTDVEVFYCIYVCYVLVYGE